VCNASRIMTGYKILRYALEGAGLSGHVYRGSGQFLSFRDLGFIYLHNSSNKNRENLNHCAGRGKKACTYVIFKYLKN